MSNEFWLENPSVLFLNMNILPRPYLSFAEQCNVVTRMIFILYIGMVLVRFQYSSIFLINSLFFIIIFYYLQKNIMSVTEGFEETLPLQNWQQIPSPDNLKILNSSQNTFCNDQFPAGHDQNFYSRNQSLAGFSNLSQQDLNRQQITPPFQGLNTNQIAPYQSQIKLQGNPKTFKAPPVVAPIYAGDYWCSEQVVPFKINSRTFTETNQSGYSVSDNFKRDCNRVAYNNYASKNLINQYENSGMAPPSKGSCNMTVLSGGMVNPLPVKNSDHIIENYSGLSPVNVQQGHQPQHTQSLPNETDYRVSPQGYLIGLNQNKVIGCGGYEVDKLKHNIPTNVPAGQCNMLDSLDQYNKNMYTIPIQPGMSMKTEIQQPPVSNLGISDTPQFYPTTCTQDTNNTVYTTHDPRVVPPYKAVPTVRDPEPNISNVYDPRYYGYGDSERTYIDDLTGQPRFYYDDVNAFRRPNFVARSNIDTFPWAQGYGPMDTNGKYGESASMINALAQNTFLNNSLQLRNDLQVSWMNKYNTEIAGQRRLAPLTRSQGSGSIMYRGTMS